MARLNTIRTLIALAAHKRWKLYQLDIKSAFLNGTLEEEMYVDQPPRFVVPNEVEKIFKLKKALCGLKQAPRACYSEIDSYFNQCGFKKSPSEATFHSKFGTAQVYDVSICGWCCVHMKQWWNDY